MHPSMLGNRYIVFISAILLLVIWQVASLVVDSAILLPSPISAMGVLVSYLSEAVFWGNVWETVLRALKSFLLTMAAGIILGLLSGLVTRVRYMLSPLITVVRSVPVMSVILLAFIWFESGTVPVFAAFLMSFPIIFENTFQGIAQTDGRLLEMAAVYGLSRRQKLLSISVPALLPFLVAGARGTIGMTWKVVIAAEVLTVPKRGIGSAMQFSQINLETSQVMAWTVTAVLLSGASQVLFSLLLRRLRKRRMLPGEGRGGQG